MHTNFHPFNLFKVITSGWRLKVNFHHPLHHSNRRHQNSDLSEVKKSFIHVLNLKKYKLRANKHYQFNYIIIILYLAWSSTFLLVNLIKLNAIAECTTAGTRNAGKIYKWKSFRVTSISNQVLIPVYKQNSTQTINVYSLGIIKSPETIIWLLL